VPKPLPAFHSCGKSNVQHNLAQPLLELNGCKFVQPAARILILDRRKASDRLADGRLFMDTLRRSFTRFVMLSAVGFGLVLATNGIARADSVAYNVSGTFSNGQQLSGQITWNTASHSVSNSILTLSSSTFNASCNGGCGAVFTSFWGAGSLSNSYEILAGVFLPNTSLFTLTVVGGGIRIMATNVSWARVVVPEAPIIVEMLIVLLGFAWLVKSGARRHFRNPLV
jgi:hypothetical protein